MNNKELLNLLLKESIIVEGEDTAKILNSLYKSSIEGKIGSTDLKYAPFTQNIGKITPASLINPTLSFPSSIYNKITSNIKPSKSGIYSNFAIYLYYLDNTYHYGFTAPNNVYSTKAKNPAGTPSKVKLESGGYYTAPDSKVIDTPQGQVENRRTFVPLVDLNLKVVQNGKEVDLNAASRQQVLEAIYKDPRFVSIWFKEVDRKVTDNPRTTSMTTFSKDDLAAIRNNLAAAIKDFPIEGGKVGTASFGVIQESQIKKFKEAGPIPQQQPQSQDQSQQNQQQTTSDKKKKAVGMGTPDTIEVLVNFTIVPDDVKMAVTNVSTSGIKAEENKGDKNEEAKQ